MRTDITHINGNVPVASSLLVLDDAYKQNKDLDFADLIVSKKIKTQLEAAVKEIRREDEILKHDLKPRLRFIFCGYPGCGKTFSACVLAHELHLPLFVILENEAEYAGSQASPSAKEMTYQDLFIRMAEERGVYLFDDFDFENGSKCKEGKKLLFNLLDAYCNNSVIVVTTKSPISQEDLGRRYKDFVLRRFDYIIDFGQKQSDHFTKLLKDQLVKKAPAGFFDWDKVSKGQRDWDKVMHATKDLSSAEIVAVCRAAIRTAILEGRKKITPAQLADEFDKRDEQIPYDRKSYTVWRSV